MTLAEAESVVAGLGEQGARQFDEQNRRYREWVSDQAEILDLDSASSFSELETQALAHSQQQQRQYQQETLTIADKIDVKYDPNNPDFQQLQQDIETKVHRMDVDWQVAGIKDSAMNLQKWDEFKAYKDWTREQAKLATGNAVNLQILSDADMVTRLLDPSDEDASVSGLRNYKIRNHHAQRLISQYALDPGKHPAMAGRVMDLAQLWTNTESDGISKDPVGVMLFLKSQDRSSWKHPRHYETTKEPTPHEVYINYIAEVQDRDPWAADNKRMVDAVNKTLKVAIPPVNVRKIIDAYGKITIQPGGV